MTNDISSVPPPSSSIGSDLSEINIALSKLLDLQESLAERLSSLFMQILFNIQETDSSEKMHGRSCEHFAQLPQIQRNVDLNFRALERKVIQEQIARPSGCSDVATKTLKHLYAFRMLAVELKVFTEALFIEKMPGRSLPKEIQKEENRSTPKEFTRKQEKPAAEDAKIALQFLRGRANSFSGFSEFSRHFTDVLRNFEQFIQSFVKNAPPHAKDKIFTMQKELEFLFQDVKKLEKRLFHEEEPPKKMDVQTSGDKIIEKLENLLTKFFEMEKNLPSQPAEESPKEETLTINRREMQPQPVFDRANVGLKSLFSEKRIDSSPNNSSLSSLISSGDTKSFNNVIVPHISDTKSHSLFLRDKKSEEEEEENLEEHEDDLPYEENEEKN